MDPPPPPEASTTSPSHREEPAVVPVLSPEPVPIVTDGARCGDRRLHPEDDAVTASGSDGWRAFTHLLADCQRDRPHPPPSAWSSRLSISSGRSSRRDPGLPMTGRWLDDRIALLRDYEQLARRTGTRVPPEDTLYDIWEARCRA